MRGKWLLISAAALLAGAFESFKDRKLRSWLIWAHARNNACFFYEAMGGRLTAERTAKLMGETVQEAAFGWRTLALAERSTAR